MPGDNVKHAVFDLFDRDDNGVVDMIELICGISLLCQGSEEDKIHAVFDIFDENGDGFISMDEMFKFLTSGFKGADLNHDGRLSITEFKEWFYAPKNDPSFL